MTNVSEVALGKSNDIYYRGLEMENPDLDFMAESIQDGHLYKSY